MPRDLFGPTPNKIGHGLATFLGDMANGVPIQQLRENWKAGRYPHACPKLLKGYMEMKR